MIVRKEIGNNGYGALTLHVRSPWAPWPVQRRVPARERRFDRDARRVDVRAVEVIACRVRLAFGAVPNEGEHAGPPILRLGDLRVRDLALLPEVLPQAFLGQMLWDVLDD